jgi:hypothetical protein
MNTCIPAALPISDPAQTLPGSSLCVSHTGRSADGCRRLVPKNVWHKETEYEAESRGFFVHAPGHLGRVERF